MVDDATPENNEIEGFGPVVVWFRVDLRLADNAALTAAAATGRPVIPLFVLEESTPDTRAPGGAKLWWLHHSLDRLSSSLRDRGVELVLRKGDALSQLIALIEQTGADAVCWNRRYGKGEEIVDEAIASELRGRGIQVRSFDGHIMHDPEALRTKTGGHYKVYTPFWNALSERIAAEPCMPVPERIEAFSGALDGGRLDDWALLPTAPDWSGGMTEFWSPGEEGGHALLKAFTRDGIEGYATERDRPDRDGTSRLSPHLALGEITPLQAWEAMREVEERGTQEDRTTFRKELVWREFSYHLLAHHPDMPRENVSDQFDRFPWAEMDDDTRTRLRAWQRGRTGYPIVDAGMRQLWHIGWMHNRVRMITASFLIKHLLIDWREGEDWFWDTLVDADAANNANGWQWVAGSGADASPFFRVFNPMLQGKKFDPEGDYVRAWVPELAKMPAKHIHEPWSATDTVLVKAGVRLGETYPEPIIEHKFARDRALAAYKEMRAA